MKTFFLYLMAMGYIAAGANHFWHPRGYLQIMPPWLPYPAQLVFISGVCEVLGGVMLLPAATRFAGAWFIILLLIAVFPANIQMAINYHNQHNPALWVALLRLPLQLLLIWWAWVYTKK